MELLELGVVFHMMHAAVPSRHADAKLIDLNRLRLEWLSRVDNAFILMRGLEKIYYGGIGRIFIKRVTEEKILPFINLMVFLQDFWDGTKGDYLHMRKFCSMQAHI